jgi:hypothetical protein
MTKDGRPSRITDIRHFFGDLHSYLNGQEEAVAFGRRIAWFLNGEGFSLGAYPALYLFFTPSLEPGTVQVTEYGGDWWQRYTHVGVSSDFPNVPDAQELVTRGTASALVTIRPDQSELIRHAEALVCKHGMQLRFLLKRHETKRKAVEISFNIAAWPNPSHMFISSTDKMTGAYAEAEPIPLRFYEEAFHLAGGFKFIDSVTIIEPKKSIGASLTSVEHGGPLAIDAAAFAIKPSRPAMSQLVGRRS